LIILPHGALHFFPFHLLGKADAPLAKEWSISFLPGLSLLGIADERSGDDWLDVPPDPSNELSALGLDFPPGNPHALPPLENASQEADSIARLFDTRAYTNGQATETRFLDLVQSSRCVHVATHGRHRVSAPSFQKIYFMPDEAMDGVLHAYEVADLDLRGVELITLSACETALGRVDQADNPRGLPASLLIAGACKIIGTLWEVETGAAEYFFLSLYGRVREGDDVFTAFQQAQLATLKEYPNYRDWGAFYLIGA
jgi:CHAT domain-containing protein